MTLRRRTLLAAPLLGLARPALAQPTRILRFVPQSDLSSIDPLWSVATVAVTHGSWFGHAVRHRPQPPAAAADGRACGGVGRRARVGVHAARRARVPRRRTGAPGRLRRFAAEVDGEGPVRPGGRLAADRDRPARRPALLERAVAAVPAAFVRDRGPQRVHHARAHRPHAVHPANQGSDRQRPLPVPGRRVAGGRAGALRPVR